MPVEVRIAGGDMATLRQEALKVKTILRTTSYAQASATTGARRASPSSFKPTPTARTPQGSPISTWLLLRRQGSTAGNAFWLRGTPRTLEILQDLGFIYHIDDVSRDEPFLVPVRNKPFAVVPYTIHTNDIVNYEGGHWTGAQFASELKYEFDQLCAEAATRRRLMSISAHDRITGRPARTKVLEDFIVCAQKQPGVVFLRKDQIARFALESSATPREGSLMQPRGAA